MADPASSAPDGRSTRFLTFRIDQSLYALPADEVAEVIRTPAVARVPLGPRALLGLANLRGAILPLASLRGLLGRDEAGGKTQDGRAIVLDAGAPMALAVDAVDALVVVRSGDVKTEEAELSAEPGEKLRGAFDSGRSGVAKILDVHRLLVDAFTLRARESRPVAADGASLPAKQNAPDRRRLLVTFVVAGQEFAFDLSAVREIVPAPAAVTAMPRAEALVLGVTSYRDTLLPLLSLRGLLGFPAATAREREKVLVTKVGGVLVGLVADGIRAVLPAEPDLIEATPSVLASRTGGEAQIGAIYRGDEGARLISILDPDRLFHGEIMQRLGVGTDASIGAEPADHADREERQFIVFRLGHDDYGLPIDAVDEVAQVPARMTRLPKAPKFIEGVINLRGDVLPVVDQRRRFDLPADDGPRRRLIVVRSDRHRAGLIVDSVSRVLRVSGETLAPAPALTGQAERLIQGVVNLEAEGRIVLILDPAELLSHAERGLLDQMHAKAGKAPA